MKAKEVIKLVGNLAVAVGAGALVGNLVNGVAMLNPNIGKISKICIGLTGGLIAGMAADSISKYMNNGIDSGCELLKNAVKKGQLE